MGKVFDDFENDKLLGPKSFYFCLLNDVKEYIASERAIFSKISSTVRDAVLLDALNYLGIYYGMSFNFYKEMLNENPKESGNFDRDEELMILYMFFAWYICNINIFESISEKYYRYKCDEKFEADEGIDVLVDFINYVAEKNGYDRVFNKRDLYEKYQRDTYARDMEELGSFLELTSGYSERLQNGEDIGTIYSKLTIDYNFECILLKDGRYSYIDKKAKEKSNKFFEPIIFNKEAIERELYALAYAYAKMNPNYQTVSLPDIVKKKIKEMKIDNK